MQVWRFVQKSDPALTGGWKRPDWKGRQNVTMGRRVQCGSWGYVSLFIAQVCILDHFLSFFGSPSNVSLLSGIYCLYNIGLLYKWCILANFLRDTQPTSICIQYIAITFLNMPRLLIGCDSPAHSVGLDVGGRKWASHWVGLNTGHHHYIYAWIPPPTSKYARCMPVGTKPQHKPFSLDPSYGWAESISWNLVCPSVRHNSNFSTEDPFKSLPMLHRPT